MKIAPTTRTPTQPRPTPEPLARIDDLGLCARIADMPDTDSAWLELTGGGERRGLLAARLVACRDRAEQAMHATAACLPLARRQREAVEETARALVDAHGHVARRDPPIPASWTARLDQLTRDHAAEVEEMGVVVARLADLMVEEYDALVCLDDAVHRAALSEPAWIDWPRGERPIPPEETSWPRVARLIGREIQLVAGMEPTEEMWDRLGAIDPHRGLGEGDLAAHEAAAREAIRATVIAVYGDTPGAAPADRETTTRQESEA